jgi:hypothetical protein
MYTEDPQEFSADIGRQDEVVRQCRPSQMRAEYFDFRQPAFRRV